MITEGLKAILPLFLLVGLIFFNVSVFGGGCVPPATCAGTELSLTESVKALVADPTLAFRGVWLITSIISTSWFIGGCFTAILYGGLLIWVYISLKNFMTYKR